MFSKQEDIRMDAKMKAQVTEDWLSEFPGYKKIGPRIWRKRVGPLGFCMGYSVTDGSTEYKIGGSYFNFANPCNFTCANLSFEPKTRFSCCTSWRRHEEGRYKQAAEEMRQQAPIPLLGPVTLSQVINAYKNHPSTSYVHSIRLLEDPALIAAWAGKVDLAKELLEWANPLYEERVACYPKNPSTEEWHGSMLERVSDPEKLHKIVEEQLKHHKLTQIPYEELIIDL